jgi:hypothetical protein
LVAVGLIAVGLATMSAFFKPQWKDTPAKLPPVEQTVENGK